MTFYVTVGIALGLSALILLTQFLWMPKASWAAKPYSRWRINVVLAAVTVGASILTALITGVASEAVAAWLWAVIMGMVVATLLVLTVEVVLWMGRHWQWAIAIVIITVGGALLTYYKLPGFREFIGTLHGS